MKEFTTEKINNIYKHFETSENGLSTEEANARLEKNGKNKLDEGKKRSLIAKFFDQLKDVMIIVLLVAAVVSAVISIVEKNYGELIDSGLILVIVLVNAIIGLIQENKAENSLEALKNMNKPYAKVLRDGKVEKIKSEDIVVGDIVVLEAGDYIPADIRLISSHSLKVEESALTGESVPVEKDAEAIVKASAPLGDRLNMVYSAGIVTYGRGTGVVVATGMDTEVGKIAGMLKESDKQTTPLQVQLAKTAKLLSILVIFIAVIIFVVSIINKTPIVESFMTAVAIAVAAIPEGLPAVVTIVLALGVKKMSERNAIVKNLPAVETLGCCEVICSDKTGTLTLNQMTVKELYTFNTGLFSADKQIGTTDSEKQLLNSMVLCNDTVINEGNKLVGDPTETALIAYAMYLNNTNPIEMRNTMKRVEEIPFDSDRKLMTTVNLVNDKKVSYTKGAVDMLLDKCTKILDKNVVRDITPHDIDKIQEVNNLMADKALRVLAYAFKEEGLNKKELEQDLIFVGLTGMIDPPRTEVKDAVRTCKKAGMRAIMITGDHKATALAIAKEIGIYEQGDLVITGAELDKLSDEEFMANLHKYRVFARVSPENKVRIVKAFKKCKMIVAMTGDGVNDAPSIKMADIGIGMGITGTDVSKGAADMVLADDNFATIICAVEEGRKVYANIKKAVQYLLSANIAEVLCLFIATIFLKVEFLTPVMILWVNLVTDSFPALALGMERAEKDIMNKKPRKTNSSLFSGKTGKDILIQGIMQTGLVMGSFCIGQYVLSGSEQLPLTMAFITLCFIQLFHSYNLKHEEKSIASSNPFNNNMLNYSFIGGAVLVVLVCTIPFLQSFFKTCDLTLVEWLIALGFSIAIIPLVEIQKVIERFFSSRRKNKEFKQRNNN